MRSLKASNEKGAGASSARAVGVSAVVESAAARPANATTTCRRDSTTPLDTTTHTSGAQPQNIRRNVRGYLWFTHSSHAKTEEQNRPSWHDFALWQQALGIWRSRQDDRILHRSKVRSE